MLVFVLLCITLCHFKACNYLNEEERAGCFALIFLMSFYLSFYVALPHCAIGWSTVCYCGISQSYSVTMWCYVFFCDIVVLCLF